MEHQSVHQNRTHGHGFPDYLNSRESLEQHIKGQLEGLSSTDKGQKFASFVQRLIPHTETGSAFDPPELCQKKSNDEGVDLIASSKDARSFLYIQSKLSVNRADEIDGVISKFHAYITEHHSNLSGRQFDFNFEDHQSHFLLITLSPLDGLIRRYKERSFASKQFAQHLLEENRLYFIDGNQILSTLSSVYRKLAELPSNIVLNLETPAIHKDTVYFGIISSDELRSLYKQFGDSLFFENIRDFLGPAKNQKIVDRITPNTEIIKTITTRPDKMLERNNGIVFGADEVTYGTSQNQLILTKGSVVNGCQTTMCLVEYADNPCYVSVKVVQTSDSWDITKAANYQNSVAYIDLELARSLRPQLAKRAATITGVRLDDGERSAFQIIDEIYNRRVAYDETRLLYIGIFSRTPNNVFEAYHEELLHNLIDKFYQNDPYGEKIFETLYELQDASRAALAEAKQTFTHPSYSAIFERIYGENKPSYTSFITILALCGAIDRNISDRIQDLGSEYERTNDFLSATRNLLQNQRDRFLRYFIHSVKVWMQEMIPIEGEEGVIRRDMYLRTRRANFTNMFRKLCMETDVDDRMGVGT